MGRQRGFDFGPLILSALPFERSEIMVKRILVPTDFSAASGGALRYACRVAEELPARVVVLHVYHPSFDLNNPYLDVPVSDFGQFKQKALDDFLREFEPLPGKGSTAGPSPALTTELIVGFAGEEIVHFAEEGDMVVMGTTGTGKKMLEKVFGSVSSYVAQHAGVPVLLIPQEASYREAREVMYASNYARADEALLKRALTELGLQPGLVHFVHADQESGVDCQVAEVRYEQLQSGDGAALPMQFVELNCERIVEGLYRYASEQEIDLIVMGTVHRNFLERLFHRSVTREMIYHSTIPLLIMHF